jgi:hypothetical protein
MKERLKRVNVSASNKRKKRYNWCHECSTRNATVSNPEIAMSGVLAWVVKAALAGREPAFAAPTGAAEPDAEGEASGDADGIISGSADVVAGEGSVRD